MITRPKAEPWTHAAQIGALPTSASFAVTRVTNLASTGIRSASVLTDSIDITNGGRSSALVNVWVNNNKNDKHNTQTCARCSCWQKVWNSTRTASLLSLITKLTVYFHIAVSKYRNIGLNTREPVITADRLSFTRLNLFTGLGWQLRNRTEGNCRGESIVKKRLPFSMSRATDKHKSELSSRWEAKP